MFDFDENRPDYFDEPDEADAPAPRPSAGDRIDFSEDDTYSLAPERRRRRRRLVAWIVAIALLLLALGMWLRYLNPYATDSVIDCYVVGVERRGVIFKTTEADIISEASLTDTARVYTRDLSVTVPSDALAAELRRLQGTGRKVRLVTERYHGMLPWRGGSTIVATGLHEENNAAENQPIHLSDTTSVI